MPREGRSASDNNVRDEGKKLVSCIIIFLNEEKYLAEAIESVIAQSYADWELLFVDDGSTDAQRDNRAFLLRAHPRKDPLPDSRRPSNRGMSASRNLGLRGAARGALAAFLDGDDWLVSKQAGTAGRAVRSASRGGHGVRGDAILAQLAGGCRP